MVSQSVQQICGGGLFDFATLPFTSGIGWVGLFTQRDQLFIAHLKVGNFFRQKRIVLFLPGGFDSLFDVQQQIKQFTGPPLLVLLDEEDEFANEMRIAQAMPVLSK